MTSPPNHRFLLTRLQQEWNLLRIRPTLVRRASAWQLTPRVLDSLDDLLVLTGLGSRPAPAGSDDALRQLVTLARHDDLAARIVLQRMLPGLAARSEEHTSELQSQRDISYAVFCLKKKKKTYSHTKKKR